jgi:hypothetical protein
LFFNNLLEQSELARSMLESRYFKMVSLSQSPSCAADIVTQLTSVLTGILGKRVLGISKYTKKSFLSNNNHSLIINKNQVVLKENINQSVSIDGIENSNISISQVLKNRQWNICSGYAVDRIEIHSMKHYLHGIFLSALKFSDDPYVSLLSNNLNWSIAQRLGIAVSQENQFLFQLNNIKSDGYRMFLA